jgi:hypothetical protein
MKYKRTSRDEISKLVTTARTYSRDARVESLSLGARFQLAYESARMWSEIVIRAEGQRLASRTRHHEKVIQNMADIIGSDMKDLAEYLGTVRKKRHLIMYEGAISEVSPDDVTDLLKVLDELEKRVTDWLESNHPDLLPLM